MLHEILSNKHKGIAPNLSGKCSGSYPTSAGETRIIARKTNAGILWLHLLKRRLHGLEILRGGVGHNDEHGQARIKIARTLAIGQESYPPQHTQR